MGILDEKYRQYLKAALDEEVTADNEELRRAFYAGVIACIFTADNSPDAELAVKAMRQECRDFLDEWELRLKGIQ